MKIINVMFVYGVWSKGWNIPISDDDRSAAHPHPNGPKGVSDRSRMGGRGCPVGHRTTVG